MKILSTSQLDELARQMNRLEDSNQDLLGAKRHMDLCRKLIGAKEDEVLYEAIERVVSELLNERDGWRDRYDKLKSITSENVLKLSELVRLPNVEHVADEHNEAVEKLRQSACTHDFSVKNVIDEQDNMGYVTKQHFDFECKKCRFRKIKTKEYRATS